MKKILINTQNWLDWLNDDNMYQEYIKECTVNNVEPKEKSSQNYTNWLIELNQQNTEDDLENIMYSKQMKGIWYITGSIGCWDGRHKIFPIFKKDLHNAIISTFMHEFEMKVSFDRKAIYVDIAHHDGTNSFVMRRLNAYSEERYTKNEDGLLASLEKIEDIAIEPKARRYFTSLPKYLF